MRLTSTSRIVNKQQGVALIMALVFLVLLTILGLTAMNTTSLEEKMAGNIKDKNAAFQAAEAALSGAESWLFNKIDRPQPNPSQGIYLFDSTTADLWESVSWPGTSNLVVYPNTPDQTISGGLTKVNTQPKYIIEDMGDYTFAGDSLNIPSNYKGKGKTILRITARGTGGTDAAVSMVQSTYGREY